MDSRHDVVIAGAGHNGLVAAAYLARAGRSVLLLERREHAGGAAVSERAFAGVDARLSRYAYLVSLLPRRIADDLGVGVALRRRRIASYTPLPTDPSRGVLVDTGSAPPSAGWARLYATASGIAPAVFASLTRPLRSREQLRWLAGDDAAWEALVERPIGELIEDCIEDDTLRGIALTDALIGTFAGAHDADLRQNRCFLYHVIGGGTGDWDVPVGGMGAVTDALEVAAVSAGAEIRTEAEVVGIGPGEVRWQDASGTEHVASAAHVLANLAPSVLDRLRGRTSGEPAPEGAQLKVNMLLTRLPKLRDTTVDPFDAFAGTFHVNEGYAQLEHARAQAASGQIPDVVPCETYCHSLTDPTILGDELRAAGMQTLTCFALHMPARLFAADPDGARERALRATIASMDSVLAEPLEDVLATDADGRPCVEARTPLDLEAELGLPGGNIFQRDLAWPFAEDEADVGRWGVETDEPSILVCGAGARRGGGVSGIPGHNAAMAVLADYAASSTSPTRRTSARPRSGSSTT